MSDLVPADITARIERMATDPNGVVQYDARTTRMLEQSMDEFRNGLAMNPDAIRVRHAYTLGRINGILTKRILDEDQVGLIPLWMRVRSEEASQRAVWRPVRSGMNEPDRKARRIDRAG